MGMTDQKIDPQIDFSKTSDMLIFEFSFIWLQNVIRVMQLGA